MNVSAVIFDFFARFAMDKRLLTMVFSFIPIVEMRGAIPIGLALRLTPFQAFLYSYLGSVAACPIMLGLFKPVLAYLKTKKAYIGFAEKMENIIQNRADSLNKKSKKNNSTAYKMFLAASFVAIPLPMTGVWTGTAVATCLGLSNSRIISAVAIGDFIAALIIAIPVIYFARYLDTILMIFAGCVILGIVFGIVKSIIKIKSIKYGKTE